MKIDREKLIQIAIKSKCTICGEAIGYNVWEYSEKSNNKFFIHSKCLKKRIITKEK